MSRGQRVGVTPREALAAIDAHRSDTCEWVVCRSMAGQWVAMPADLYTGEGYSWMTLHADERAARRRLLGLISADRISTPASGAHSGTQ